MGLSDDEFWSSTPRKLQYLERRWKWEREYLSDLFRFMACITANHSIRRPEKPYTPDDFKVKREKATPVEDIDDNEVAWQINAIMSPHSIPVTRN